MYKLTITSKINNQIQIQLICIKIIQNMGIG